jgi:hypothetical protein
MGQLEILNPGLPDWQALLGTGTQAAHSDGSDGHFTGTSGAPGTLPGTADGQQYMWIFSNSAFSNGRLDYLPPISALANTTYTLTAAAGQRKTDTDPGGRIDVILVLDGAQVAVTSLNEVVAGIPNDTFVDVSTSYTTGAGDAGKPLGIRLAVFGQGGVAFDNIRLEFVPEPGALPSLGSGMMLLGWLDRRRRRRAIGV